MRLDVNCVKMLIVTAILVLASSQTVQAEQVGALTLKVGSPVESQATLLTDVVDVQMYNRSIHIMVMLLVGFGFLMVFVKKYGLSAVTATYLLVSTAIPLYMLIKSCGILGEPSSG